MKFGADENFMFAGVGERDLLQPEIFSLRLP